MVDSPSAHAQFKEIEHFEHTALDHTVDQIRLFRLCKPETTPIKGRPEVIECRLGTYDLDIGHSGESRTPPYCAVSYAWGSPLPACQILVNGQLFVVRENLYECLRALRHCGHDEELFWVDQLCINQQNLAERNHQVHLMGSIYSHANHVLAWLGYGELNARLAFDILHMVSDEAADFINQKDCFHGLELVAPNALRNTSREDMSHVIALTQQPYWTRLWVVQEVVLAHDLIFMYGHHKWQLRMTKVNTSSYPFWQSIASSIYKVYRSQISASVKFYEAFKLLAYREERVRRWLREPDLQQGLAINLGRAISMAEPRICSDIRDKVFALQMCVSQHERIDIDYGLSSAQVFLRVLRQYRSFYADREEIKDDIGNRVCSDLRRISQMMALKPWTDEEFMQFVFGTWEVDESDLRLCAKLEPEGDASDSEATESNPPSHQASESPTAHSEKLVRLHETSLTGVLVDTLCNFARRILARRNLRKGRKLPVLV